VLRQYQRESVDAVWRHIKEKRTNPAVVLPTGAGKTHVIAQICKDAVAWDGRVVVLAHVKELLEQSAEKLRLAAPQLPVGVFSAGLGRRDVGYAVTIAGIQSVYQRAHELGPIDIVIVDEAHMIPAEGEGMYRRFLADSGSLCEHQRVIGLTATPYRTKEGPICTADGILNEVCIEVGIRELIAGGYLSPVRSFKGAGSPDTSGLHVRAGEFIAAEAEDLMGAQQVIETACADIIDKTKDRRSVLIFTAGVDHCLKVADELRNKHGAECAVVTGDTDADDRAEVIERFRAGRIKYLANVNVFTTGFDAPNVDCVALLRPTMSPGLYYQMVGRGFRISPGKYDCLVLDYGGNVLRHGPVDAIRIEKKDDVDGRPPAKECPGCNALIATGFAVCPECGHKFPDRKGGKKHGAQASEEDVLSGNSGPRRETYEVQHVGYYTHEKRNDPTARPTMRVEYQTGFSSWVKEWICIEHNGFAYDKARHWWSRRSALPMPVTVEEAVSIAIDGGLAEPTEITVETKPGDKWERVVDYMLGPIPENNAERHERPRWDDPNNSDDDTGSLAYWGDGVAPSDDIPF
jgi:DNA repair protein RadD